MRVDEENWMRIIGTAVVKKGRVEPTRAKRKPKSFRANEEIMIGVDVETVYILVCSESGECSVSVSESL